jgi:hypothetical protein
VDRLIRDVAEQQGMRSTEIDQIVALVDQQLDRNRAAAG